MDTFSVHCNCALLIVYVCVLTPSSHAEKASTYSIDMLLLRHAPSCSALPEASCLPHSPLLNALQVWPGMVYYPDWFNPATQPWWTRAVQRMHSQVPLDGLWIDMNEAASFCTGTICRAPDPKVNNESYYCEWMCVGAGTQAAGAKRGCASGWAQGKRKLVGSGEHGRATTGGSGAHSTEWAHLCGSGLVGVDAGMQSLLLMAAPRTSCSAQPSLGVNPLVVRCRVDCAAPSRQ